MTPRPSGGTLRQRVMVGAVGVLILAAAVWLALIIVSRIDELFFPGQGIGGLPSLPGVQTGDESVRGQFNVLVMGLDRRPSEGNLPTRTDTMFVVMVDSATNTAGLVGIPRDTWVEIPYTEGEGYYEARVNTAFRTGEEMGYSGGGPGLVKDVVEHNLGIEVDHHVVIDFEGFVALIDELDGVDVYVEEEIDDPTYSETELPGDFTPLHFEVGLQHMDGQTALNYSRTRFDSSDLERIKRQQQVIFAAMDKALDRGLADVNSVNDLWSKYEEAIDTDINSLEAPGFAALAAKIGPENINAITIGVATRAWTAPDGQQVLLVDKDLVRQLVQSLLVDDDLEREAAQVEVQNAAGTDGLASSVVAYLAEFGFQTSLLTEASSADGSVKPLTEIIDYTGKAHTVERLQGVLKVPDGRVRIAGPADAALRTIDGADVVVILGADAQAADFSTEVELPDEDAG